MPIYQYRCTKCGFDMEALQKINEPPLVHCEACHSESLEKCITAAAVRLNGKGYYETDEKPQAKQRHIARKESESAPACPTPKSCGTSTCG